MLIYFLISISVYFFFVIYFCIILRRNRQIITVIIHFENYNQTIYYPKLLPVHILYQKLTISNHTNFTSWFVWMET
jgi:hypothetical protein